MWARSYWRFDSVDYSRMREGGVGRLFVHSRRGQLTMSASSNTPAPPLSSPGWHAWSADSAGFPREPLSVRNLGFGFAHVPDRRIESYVADAPQTRYAYRQRLTVLSVPHWFVAVLCASPLLVRLGRGAKCWRQERALDRIGRCPTCGYDCRATPQAGGEGGALLRKCPECGTVVRAADVQARAQG